MLSTQIKPFPWACLITAFATAMNTPVRHLIDAVGHDGGEVIWPNLGEPVRRRGHHVQEIIRVVLAWGYTATPVELFPVIKSTYDAQIHIVQDCESWSRFKQLVQTTAGVIEGRGLRCHHAVAYDCGLICDPDDGHTYTYSREACEDRNFFTQKLWLINKN